MKHDALSPAIRVGPILGPCPQPNAHQRDLMRITLPQSVTPDVAVRTVLDVNAAIEIVDDPFGITYEAVPFETLIQTGSLQIADSLRQTLPRFFAPLAYRPLTFSVQHLPGSQEGASSVLFGNLLDPGLGAPRGSIQLRDPGGSTALHTPHWPDGPSGSPLRWRLGQRHAVVALTDTPQADGLPRCNLRADTGNGTDLAKAVVVRPGAAGPVAELRAINPTQSGVPALAPALGATLADAEMRRDDAFELFSADLGPGGPSIVIAPDSAFSRFISGPRPGVDLLEIRGLFLPPVGGRSGVVAAALRFDVARRFCAHGLCPQASRLLLLGHQGHFLQQDGGTMRKLGRDGPSSDLGLRLTRGRKVDPMIPRGWTALTAEEAQPLGWIPLRLGPASETDELRVEKSPLTYTRARWIDRRETKGDAAAIILDWLDEAVELVVRQDGGGTLRQGLARYIAGLPANQLGTFAHGLAYDPRGLELVDGNANRNRLQDGQCFRLGPLWVRLAQRQEAAP